MSHQRWTEAIKGAASFITKYPLYQSTMLTASSVMPCLHCSLCCHSVECQSVLVGTVEEYQLPVQVAHHVSSPYTSQVVSELGSTATTMNVAKGCCSERTVHLQMCQDDDDWC